MAMHNLKPSNLSGRELAAKLGVSASPLNRILTGAGGISPEMALRLSKALGRTEHADADTRAAERGRQATQ